MSRSTPVRAIRAKCLECQGGSRKGVRDCTAECPLLRFRMGKNPNRAGIAPGAALKSLLISKQHRSRDGRFSPRIDSGDKDRMTGAGSGLGAPKRRKIVRAAPLILEEIEG